MRRFPDTSILRLVLPFRISEMEPFHFQLMISSFCALELQHNESAYDQPPHPLFLGPKTDPRIHGIKEAEISPKTDPRIHCIK